MQRGSFGQSDPEPEPDPWEHPNFRAFAKRVRTELVPKIEASGASVGVFTGTADVKMAVEMGYSLLLGKPIIVAVMRGAKVPDGLARAADEIIEVDEDLVTAGPRIKAALDRINAAREAKGEQL